MTAGTLRTQVLAEFIGTFGLVFAGCGAITINAVTGGAIGHIGIALSFGLIVMAMIYAVGHTSGAHINPAVTLALCATRQFPIRQVPAYLTAQFAGAITAAFVLRIMFGNVAGLGATAPRNGSGQSLVLELLLTFVLMFVIMAVATDVRAAGQTAAIAIGGTVGLCALFAGPISGASMNPARSIGPAIVSGTWTGQWLYVAGPVVGALAGAFVYQLIREPQVIGETP